MSTAFLDAGHALLRRIRDGAWSPVLPRPARLRLLRQGPYRFDLCVIHEDGQAIPRPWMLLTGGDPPQGLPPIETAALLEALAEADPDLEEALVCTGAALIIPARPVGSNAPVWERSLRLRALPGPPPFPLLSEHRPAEAVRRLLAEGLPDGEHDLVSLEEPSAHRRLARQPLVQILEETGIDTAIGAESRLSYLQEEGVGALVWRTQGIFPLVRGIVRR